VSILIEERLCLIKWDGLGPSVIHVLALIGISWAKESWVIFGLLREKSQKTVGMIDLESMKGREGEREYRVGEMLKREA
jgi:hypothetical protein